jgi:hypothetical protein
MLAKQVLTVVLLPLLAFPAWASPKVVGTVSTSETATVRGTALAPGTTLYAGDRVDVGAKGTALISLRQGARLLIGDNSRVRLVGAGEAVEAEVETGRAALRLAGTANVAGVLGDAIVRPATDAAIANIGLTSATQGFIFAEQGELLVTSEGIGETVRLREGEGLEITLAEAAPATVATEDEDARRRRRRALVWGLFLAGGVTAAALAITLNRDKLSDKEKSDAVSPFRFP